MTDAPPAVSGPFVDTYAEHDQQHFGYLAKNGEIWDAFYCPGCSGNKWQKQKINSGGVTDAPPAASGPFVNVFSGHDQQHFAYLATRIRMAGMERSGMRFTVPAAAAANGKSRRSTAAEA